MDDANLTLLFDRIDRGDEEAAAALLPAVYGELRRMAAARMAPEWDARTLQPTALVHEAWLRLGADGPPRWKSRGHFFAAAGEAMRRILIDHARRKQAIRRGRGVKMVRLDETGIDLGVAETPDDELLLLNDALEALARHDPRRADLVKQRFFIGLTFPEVTDRRHAAAGRSRFAGQSRRARARARSPRSLRGSSGQLPGLPGHFIVNSL